MDYCFYFAWKGLTPSEWAAWVQAIFSVIAILAAGTFPVIHERLMRRRAINSFVAIFAELVDKGHGDLNFVRFAADRNGCLEPEQLHDWEAMRRLLATMPFHSLPDHRLFPMIQEADSAIKEMQRLFAESKGNQHLPELISTQHRRLKWCYGEACKLSDSTGFGIKAWRTKVDPITDRVNYTNS